MIIPPNRTLLTRRNVLGGTASWAASLFASGAIAKPYLSRAVDRPEQPPAERHIAHGG